ncbi:hypothetical protein AAC978_11865 [Desulfitobacterium sp. THU1]|uniref:hypothetical protein n=1 Tax=Desulfitobacterium sp. THU1 TaxID=3138072 RepID=UPI00311DB0EC
MMHYVNLSQKINGSLTSFLQLYPMYREYQKEILGLTEKRMAHRECHKDMCTIDQQFVEYQLGVDITVELTKAAMHFKALPEPMEAKNHTTYDKQGKLACLTLATSYYA